MNQQQQIMKPQKSSFGWILVISTLICLFLIHAWIRTESNQTLRRISNARAELAKTLSYREALALERDRLKSDARITRIAMQQLGLSADTFEQIIYLEGDTP